jgi:hypothetical protein
MLLNQTATKLFLKAYASHDCSQAVEMLARDIPPVAIEWLGFVRRRPVTESELKALLPEESVLMQGSEVLRLSSPSMPDVRDAPIFKINRPSRPGRPGCMTEFSRLA